MKNSPFKSKSASKKFKVDGIYDLYAGAEDGRIIINRINIRLRKPTCGCLINTEYLRSLVRGSNDVKFKDYNGHRFIFECYNGIIPKGIVIDQQNKVKTDNKRKNLQLITQQQNCPKSGLLDQSTRVHIK